jgi:predicted RNA polymerase sigma factor
LRRRFSARWSAGTGSSTLGEDAVSVGLRAIAEGQALLTRTLGAGLLGPYQIQAAIAAVQTDWSQILALYEVLAQVAPGPVVTLSRAVASARVHGRLPRLNLIPTTHQATSAAGPGSALGVRPSSWPMRRDLVAWATDGCVVSRRGSRR